MVGVHGVGGTLGAIATGLFASAAINAAGADGAFFGNPMLVLKQLVAVAAVIAWSFGMSLGLLKAVDALVGLRVPEDDEELGLDLARHSESGYALRRRRGARASAEPAGAVAMVAEPASAPAC